MNHLAYSVHFACAYRKRSVSDAGEHQAGREGDRLARRDSLLVLRETAKFSPVAARTYTDALSVYASKHARTFRRTLSTSQPVLRG